jgi:biotin-(acetyl-CoA carboxylase) ligase
LPKEDTGVIAQEVQEVFPRVVFMKANGDLSVKYEKFVGLLIEAVKELSGQVTSLQAQVNALTTSTNV